MKNDQKKKRSIIKNRIVYNAVPMNTETPVLQESPNSTVSVEPTVDGAWQIVVRVGFFPSRTRASEAAKYLLRGTMWEEYKNVLENFNITIH